MTPMPNRIEYQSVLDAVVNQLADFANRIVKACTSSKLWPTVWRYEFRLVKPRHPRGSRVHQRVDRRKRKARFYPYRCDLRVDACVSQDNAVAHKPDAIARVLNVDRYSTRTRRPSPKL